MLETYRQETLVEEREKNIQKIKEDMQEIQNNTEKINELVEYQGDRLDSILVQQEQIEVRAQKANADLDEARKFGFNVSWVTSLLLGLFIMAVILISMFMFKA